MRVRTLATSSQAALPPWWVGGKGSEEGGEVLELRTKRLLRLHSEEDTSPGVALGKKDEYGAHQQTSIIFDEK